MQSYIQSHEVDTIITLILQENEIQEILSKDHSGINIKQRSWDLNITSRLRNVILSTTHSVGETTNSLQFISTSPVGSMHLHILKTDSIPFTYFAFSWLIASIYCAWNHSNFSYKNALFCQQMWILILFIVQQYEAQEESKLLK